MDISSIIIIIMLLATIILLSYLIYMVRQLKQPILHIDEKSAELIAKKLGELKVHETNEYDAIKAAFSSPNIDDYEYAEIIRAIKNSKY